MAFDWKEYLNVIEVFIWPYTIVIGIEDIFLIWTRFSPQSIFPLFAIQIALGIFFTWFIVYSSHHYRSYFLMWRNCGICIKENQSFKKKK